MTLEEMIERERTDRVENGSSGLKACKESVRFEAEHSKQSLFTLLEDYYHTAIDNDFFNKRMVLACWELINGIE